jgi:Mg2+/Co2+ transporter CorB
MPLWRDAGEDVIGILDAESVLRAFWAAGGDASRIDLPSLAMPATFVPDTRLLRNQLQEFRNAHLQMSLVVDEYGSVKGLVTLEDIIEVVVGPIAERGEAITPMESADGTVDVRGDVRVRDLNRELEWSLPEDEAVTLGGLAVAMFGGVPPLGKEIIIGDYRASVLERRGLRIDRIAIRKIPAAPLEQA